MAQVIRAVQAMALAFVLGIAGAPAAHAWGAGGHRLTLELAYARLTPAARAAFDRLLAAGPAHPIAECPLATRAQVATWPDCARFQDPFKGTYDEHFDDIPLFGRATRQDWCGTGVCASAAIRRNFAVLSDTSAPDGARLEALAFLVHYIGDIHQPLHAADNKDRGGNDVKVAYLGMTTYPGRNGEPADFNLHGIWDTPIAEAAMAVDGADLIARETDRLLRGGSRFDPDAWARQSHQLAVRSAYGWLPVRMAPGHPPAERVAVDRRYVDKAVPVARTQLARAAARLTRTLNAALGATP